MTEILHATSKCFFLFFSTHTFSIQLPPDGTKKPLTDTWDQRRRCQWQSSRTRFGPFGTLHTHTRVRVKNEKGNLGQQNHFSDVSEICFANGAAFPLDPPPHPTGHSICDNTRRELNIKNDTVNKLAPRHKRQAKHPTAVKKVMLNDPLLNRKTHKRKWSLAVWGNQWCFALFNKVKNWDCKKKNKKTSGWLASWGRPVLARSQLDCWVLREETSTEGTPEQRRHGL